MGRTLENKQQIVTEIKSLLNDSEMAVVLDYKGLTIKEMSDLRSRLQTTNGICKVTKNSLMRKAIDGDSNWNDKLSDNEKQMKIVDELLKDVKLK